MQELAESHFILPVSKATAAAVVSDRPSNASGTVCVTVAPHKRKNNAFLFAFTKCIRIEPKYDKNLVTILSK